MFRGQQLLSTISSKKMDFELHEVPTESEIEFEVAEVRIRLPWSDATLAGKWWGSKNIRPIVCMHGWQDNAGTFDRLIPLLPRDRSFLCLDLPGHGLSSRMPDGMAYHVVDNLHLLNYICKQFNWKTISLMGHSMGSVLGFNFASVFPSMVDLLIQIDALKPIISSPSLEVATLENITSNFMIADQRNQAKGEPPSYTFEDLVERLHLGTDGSVTKDCAKYLLKRNIKRSEKFPGKFYFSRDPRLKFKNLNSFPQSIALEFAKRLEIPHLFIKAKHAPYFECSKYFDEVLDVLKKSENFESHIVDSTHHVHLSEPEKVAPIISKFIEKHHKVNNKL